MQIQCDKSVFVQIMYSLSEERVLGEVIHKLRELPLRLLERLVQDTPTVYKADPRPSQLITTGMANHQLVGVA